MKTESHSYSNPWATFIRLIDENDKESALGKGVRKLRAGAQPKGIFKLNPETFKQVPGAPFSYWVGESTRKKYLEFGYLENGDRRVERGLFTGDDFRFLRCHWEVPVEAINAGSWQNLAKGGEYSPYYHDVHLCLKVERGLIEIHHSVVNKYPYLKGNSDWVLHPECSYGRAGLTYPLRTTSAFSVRVLPAGCYWTNKGISIFESKEPNPDKFRLFPLLGLLNSRPFSILLGLRLGAGDAAARGYEEGIVATVPVPPLEGDAAEEVGNLAEKAWRLRWRKDSSDPVSHAFVLPAVLQEYGVTLSGSITTWAERVANYEKELVEIQSEIDECCFNLYGFTAEERKQLKIVEKPDNEERRDSSATARGAATLGAEFVDWLVGAAFGRFDVRLAIGQRQWPAEPEPFEPLPVCSPGMLTDDRGFPVGSAPSDYPLELPYGGLLVDDPGLDADLPAEWDIVRRIREVLNIVFGDKATDIEAELCDLLGTRDFRTYLRRPSAFFSDHLNRYSKSRRKAPIYWPLSTASGNYTVWVYYPNLNSNTLYQILNEHVAPKISEVEIRLAQIDHERAQTEGREATRLAKSINELTGALVEFKELQQNIQQAAEVPYMPDQDDGVQITAAPLWQLFKHKPWRKLLEKTWRELSNGEYDWAHLAYAIWPDRVKDKCREDKSLAIAHDLEDLYEGED